RKLNPVDYRAGAGRVGIRQCDQKFVAPVSNGSVRPSNRALEQRGKLAKNKIAGQVTESSIDLLKVVHVNQQESQRSVHAPCLTDETVGQLFQRPAIVDFRQRIGKGLQANQLILHRVRDRLLPQLPEDRKSV